MTRTLTVVSVGGLVTVQDRGRFGWAHLGVPRAGALDQPAADLANRLVGNDLGDAVLEATLGGVEVTVQVAASVAVTGARCHVRVNGRSVAFGEPVSVPAGARVALGRATEGVRSYLAVAGGIMVEAVLGSRSTDTLAGVGPAVVAAGRVLPLGAPRRPRALDVPARRARPDGVRVTPGPRADWFGPDALASLCAVAWQVLPASNRVGLRLDGPALPRVQTGELASEGTVLGSVQVPPDGRPVVFLHDHPVTGGYPVLAVVDEEDLAVCAQLRPGERLRFLPG